MASQLRKLHFATYQLILCKKGTSLFTLPQNCASEMNLSWKLLWNQVWTVSIDGARQPKLLKGPLTQPIGVQRFDYRRRGGGLLTDSPPPRHSFFSLNCEEAEDVTNWSVDSTAL
jgi:hypothetical protein